MRNGSGTPDESVPLLVSEDGFSAEDARSFAPRVYGNPLSRFCFSTWHSVKEKWQSFRGQVSSAASSVRETASSTTSSLLTTLQEKWQDSREYGRRLPFQVASFVVLSSMLRATNLILWMYNRATITSRVANATWGSYMSGPLETRLAGPAALGAAVQEQFLTFEANAAGAALMTIWIATSLILAAKRKAQERTLNNPWLSRVAAFCNIGLILEMYIVSCIVGRKFNREEELTNNSKVYTGEPQALKDLQTFGAMGADSQLLLQILFSLNFSVTIFLLRSNSIFNARRAGEAAEVPVARARARASGDGLEEVSLNSSSGDEEEDHGSDSSPESSMP